MTDQSAPYKERRRLRASDWLLFMLGAFQILSAGIESTSGRFDAATFHLAAGWFMFWVLERITDA